MDLSTAQYYIPQHHSPAPPLEPTRLKPTSLAIQVPIWELFMFPTGDNELQRAGTFLKSDDIDVWTTFISRTKNPDEYFVLFYSSLRYTDWGDDNWDTKDITDILNGIRGVKDVFYLQSRDDIGYNHFWVQENIPEDEGWDSIMFAYHNYRVRDYEFQHRVTLSKDTLVTFDMGIESWRY